MFEGVAQEKPAILLYLLIRLLPHNALEIFHSAYSRRRVTPSSGCWNHQGCRPVSRKLEILGESALLGQPSLDGRALVVSTNSVVYVTNHRLFPDKTFPSDEKLIKC